MTNEELATLARRAADAKAMMCAVSSSLREDGEKIIKEFYTTITPWHILSLLNEIKEGKERTASLRLALGKQDDEICQTLGKALKFPWFKDDQKNFPGATEKDGVCVGPYVAIDLANIAAMRIKELEAELLTLKKETQS